VHEGDTTGILNFLGPMSDWPVFYARQLHKTNLNLVPHEVAIHDYRVRSATLEKEGFALFEHELDIGGETDSEAIARAYFPSLNELIKRVTGASKVLHSRPLLRWKGEAPKGAPDNSKPARFVHSDYNIESFYGFAHKMMEKDPDRGHWLGGRIAAFNVWRVLTAPPQDMPLAVLDKSSIEHKDQVKATSYIDDPKWMMSHGATLWRYSEGQRWSYFSNMKVNEVLVFLSYDSEDHDVAGPAHSAFDNPLCPPDAAPRISLETRVFCYWGARDNQDVMRGSRVPLS
jgi:hypothetical protein